MQADYTFKNGRFDLPPSAKGVILVPIEHRGERANVPVVVRSKAPKSRLFTSLFPFGANPRA